MTWEEEALEILDQIAVPPIMGSFVKLDAERRARQKGSGRITAAIAKATQRGYERTLGSEATEMVRAMQCGEDVGLPDAFFEEAENELYSVELCPAKFGACTREKREMMLDVIVPVREKLKALNTTRIIIDKAKTPIMSHHVLRVSVVGCSNCCSSPYFSDIGIVALYRPEAAAQGCTGCRACVEYCSENAISLQGGQQPAVDFNACVLCGGCEKECREGVIRCRPAGYKVVAGGCGSRHPRIAETVAKCTDAAGVLKIIENGITLLERMPDSRRDVCFHDVVRRYGAKALLKK